MSPLSNLQKRDIAIAARKAYDAWDGREAFELINDDRSKSDCFNSWRHVEQGKAIGIQSLREATQAHYGSVLAHFKALAGDEAGAQRTRVRDADNDRRIARYKLDEALRERGLNIEYAATICRSKYKRGLDEVSAAKVWTVVYDIRSRRKPVAAPALKPPTGGNPF